jgi:hypothetical protein
MIIYPYLQNDVWVFDDAVTGLKAEPFVQGATEMISRLVAVKEIVEAERGFALTFGDTPFERHDVALMWVRADEVEGNWYEGIVAGESMVCWLCPALFCYFEKAPKRIYVGADPLPAVVNPIWEPQPGEETRRFVEP